MTGLSFCLSFLAAAGGFSPMADPRIDPDATVTCLSLPVDTIATTPARAKRKFPVAIVVVLAALIVVAIVVIIGVAVPSVRQDVKSWLGIASVPKQKQLAVLEFQAVNGTAE